MFFKTRKSTESNKKLKLYLKYKKNKKLNMSPEYHQDCNVTKPSDIKTEMLPKPKGLKTKISPKLQSHKNWNVNKTEISLKLKCYQTR